MNNKRILIVEIFNKGILIADIINGRGHFLFFSFLFAEQILEIDFKKQQNEIQLTYDSEIKQCETRTQ